MERTVKPKGINHVDWLLPHDLTWYLSDGVLNAEDGLENEYIYAPGGISLVVLILSGITERLCYITAVVILNMLCSC
jgi:hypothetical protein